MVSRRTFLASVSAASVALHAAPRRPDAFVPATSLKTSGLLADSLALWRTKHFWRVANEPSVLGVFEQGLPLEHWLSLDSPGEPVVWDGGRYHLLPAGEKRDYLDPRGTPTSAGRMLYHGEHVGKWIDAGIQAALATGDAKMRSAVDTAVDRLIATQKANGYIGIYPEDRRFTSTNDPHVKSSWDVWNCRYVLQGLLTYHEQTDSAKALAAAHKLGQLLSTTFKDRSIAEVGTWDGLASSTLLEPIVVLYRRTNDPQMIAFAKRIVTQTEASQKLRTLSRMIADDDVTLPGRGKAYELMSNLLGYCELYRETGDPQYSEAAQHGWARIRKEHLLDTGGPWTSARGTAHRECFSDVRNFGVDAVVETCSAVTWLQLSLSLLRITGEAKYAQEAERVLLNHMLAVQAPDGVSWTTHPPVNAASRDFSARLSCCASSGPRALETFARHVVGVREGALVLNSYLPLEAATSLGAVKVEGTYPSGNEVKITLQPAQKGEFAVELAPPFGSGSIRVRVNGKPPATSDGPNGFLRIRRKWAPGDAITLRFEMPERSLLRSGIGGQRWEAMMRGPVLLARDVPGPDDSPLKPYWLSGRSGGGYQSLFPYPPGAKW